MRERRRRRRRRRLRCSRGVRRYWSDGALVGVADDYGSVG
jgi:hypothetical protein